MTESTVLETERAIVGALLVYPTEAFDIFAQVKDRYFSSQIVAGLFRAAKQAYENDETIDVIAIRRNAELLNTVARPADLTACMESVSAVAAVQSHIDFIRDRFYINHFKSRIKTVNTMGEVVTLATKVLEWNAGEDHTGQRSPTEIIKEILKRQVAINDGTVEAGYSWGITALDNHIMLRPGKFYCIGGMKKGAKTLFLLSTIDHNLSTSPPVPILMFSLEMTDVDIYLHLMSRRARVNSRFIHTRFLSDDDFDCIRGKADELEKIPLVVDDSPGLNLTDIYARARSWKAKTGVQDGQGIIAVDFLQLIDMSENKQRVAESTLIKQTAYGLAKLAKELKVCVVALVQMRNEGEGQVPNMRFLEGSGAIAQAAEGILLLDLESRRGEEDHGFPKKFNVMIGGQRRGESGITIKCMADLRYVHFFEGIEHVFDPFEETS